MTRGQGNPRTVLPGPVARVAVTCGAASANLRPAVRRLGWAQAWAPFPDPLRPGLVMRVRAGRGVPPTAVEAVRYRAIGARRSHRARFAGPPPAAASAALVHAHTAPDTAVHLVTGAETGALARLLVHAAALIRDDRAYQRELASWTTEHPAGDAHRGRRPQRPPDGGAALRETWLAATAMNLAAPVLTQPPAPARSARRPAHAHPSPRPLDVPTRT